MRTSRTLLGILALTSACVAAAPAQANDTLKLAVGQRGNWDTIVAQLGHHGHPLSVEL